MNRDRRRRVNYVPKVTCALRVAATAVCLAAMCGAIVAPREAATMLVVGLVCLVLIWLG